MRVTQKDLIVLLATKYRNAEKSGNPAYITRARELLDAAIAGEYEIGATITISKGGQS